MGTDDGSFFPPTDDDYRDRFIDVISLASQRVSLAVLSAGFALAGANLVAANTTAGYVSLGAAAVFGIWAAAAQRI